MGLRGVLAALPAGYEVARGRRGWLACETSARRVLATAGFGPDGGEELPQSDLAGRAPLGAIQAGAERWIVRRFQHGGLFRVLGERLFLAPARPFRELLLAEALRARGLPTPRIVAARAVRCAPFGWGLCLVSARVESAVDGAEILARLRRGELTCSERRRFLESGGELVGRLHAACFWHADLTPKNLLFAVDLATAWVLDLDRGRFDEAGAARARRDNLRRLYRAVRRREARGPEALARGDYRRFLAGYARGLGGAADWRADWRAIVRRDRLASPLHRLGWWLEERLMEPRLGSG
jgi:tRNA A-37 threonylcarbamoyl transferase component Bud32